MTLSPQQQTYAAVLDRIEAEKLTALNRPGANADQLSIVALRKMSTALQAFSLAAHSHCRRGRGPRLTNQASHQAF